MAIKTTAFDVAEYLDSPAAIAAYIEAASEEDDGFFLSALNDVARAKGMSALAEESGVTREALYKALGAAGNPRFDTLNKILRSYGLRLADEPVG